MKENMWTIIGSIAGVLAVIFTVWFFYQGRSDQSKKFEIELFARSSLFDESVSHTKRRIEILYDGRKIPNYVILQFRVANTGGQPIRGDDYEEPVKLHFKNVAEILSIEQKSADPKELTISPTIEKKTDGQPYIQFPRTLLNPRDWYVLEVGVAAEPGKKPGLETKGRIAGVKQIVFREVIPSPTRGREQVRNFVTILGAVGSIIVAFISFLQAKKPQTFISLLGTKKPQ
jgi:hypothetical protein